MVIKCKTVSKVAKTFKAAGKAKQQIAATEKIARKAVEESEDESEEVESEEETTQPAKTMKKAPAKKVAKKAAAKKAAESEDESEEASDDSEEEESDEEEAPKKTMKKPAAAAKAKDESEVESEESEEEESDEEEAPAKTMKKPAAAAKPKLSSQQQQKQQQKLAAKKAAAAAAAKAKAEKKAGKAAAKAAKAAAKAAKAKAEAEEESEESEEEESDEEEAPVKTMKKPAAAAAQPMEVESESEEEFAAQIVPVAEENKEPTEKEVVAERVKELKSMYVSDLKDLALSLGLDSGSKDAVIKAILKHEGKMRVAAQEHKAKIRTVVIKKKQELEALSLPELGKLCNEIGLKGLKGKPERVQRLLVEWQETDGVDKALTEIAQKERQTELEALDDAKLRKLCSKIGVDPFVKEIAVERISSKEYKQGCYSRPAIKEPEEAPKEEKKGDMIEALLASEAQRKKEQELRSQKEEAVAKKMKEFKAMSVEELAKRIAKKGLKATGKREDMVQALFIAAVQEDAVIARKAALQAKSTQDLKDLLLLNGLEAGSKEHMVKTMLAHEATVREELKVFEAKVDELASKKLEELAKKSKAQLKDMCANKDLPVGGDQEERIERILEASKKDHEFDQTVSMSNRNKRKQELMTLDGPAVLKMCEKTGVEAFVSDIMVERIIAHENKAGQAIAAKDVEPAAKKSRK